MGYSTIQQELDAILLEKCKTITATIRLLCADCAQSELNRLNDLDEKIKELSEVMK